MKTLLITQARWSSTRLPGKVALTVRGKPLLHWHLERCLQAMEVHEFVCAIADEPGADLIQDMLPAANHWGACFSPIRGPVHNVLARYCVAAAGRKADIIVRVTSDCPLLDASLIDLAVQKVKDGYDYVSNTINRTYPKGLDVEAFKAHWLYDARDNATTAFQEEHVTPWIRDNADRIFSIEQAEDNSALNLSVDTLEDLVRVREHMMGLRT